MTELVEVDAKHRIKLPPGFDPDRSMIVSSTQLETFRGVRESCERKWWFGWPHGLPRLKAHSAVFGSVTHSVLERFFRADDLGRDEHGNPVELYPVGWETDPDSGDSVSPVEADLIQKLVAKAIEEGIAVRQPGRRVEHEFLRVLAVVRGITVFISGFIDLLLLSPELAEIQDHKTTGSLKWAKSPAALRNANQMLIYAHEALELIEEEHGVKLDEVRVGHNVFCRDAKHPAVRAVRAVVTRAEIDAHWAKCQATAVDMVRLKFGFRNLERWKEVKGPEHTAAACNAYSGCPYRPICGSRREHPERFRERVSQLMKKEDQTMGGLQSTFADKMAARKVPPAKPAGTQTINGQPPKSPPPKPGAKPAATQAPPPKMFWIELVDGSPELKDEDFIKTFASKSDADFLICPEGGEWGEATKLGFVLGAPETTATTKATEQAPAEGEKQAMPTAREDCGACKDNPVRGLNTKFRGCPVCDSRNAKENKPTSGDYDFEVKDGVLSWKPKTAGEGKSEGSAALPETPDPKTETQEDTTTTTEGAPAEGEKKKRGPGRPKSTGTFTLYLGCAPVKGGSKVIYLHEIMAKLGQELAERSQVADYYELKPFERRDEIATAARALVDEWAGCSVIVLGRGPDLQALVDAVAPGASTIVAAASI